MRSISSASMVAFIGTISLIGCTGEETGGTEGVGGSIAAVGGATPTGTTTPIPGVGGATGSSSVAFGGAVTRGGSSGVVGGSSSSTVISTGGSTPSGGATAKGGSPSTGGSSSKGGSTAKGGSPSTGGTSSKGGSTAKGGTTSTGGTTARGGSSSTGGTPPVAFKCDNLRVAAGTSGQAKPSGAAGGLKVLDWAGFKGAVSFTFDDGNTSQITNYSKLQATGAKVTFFLVSGWSNASNAVWKTAVTDGHGIANHTKSHQSAGSLADLQAAEDFIKSTFNVVAYSMAAPNGDASWASVAPQLLLLNRGVSNGLIGPRDSSNQYNLPAYLPPSGASSSTMDGEVNAAKSAGKWKIFCVHGFTGDSSAYQPVDATNMATTMSNAVKGGVWTETMTNVGAYWIGQKLIPASATTTATWTLPAHFPPNMCLRVTTTGGTVKQNGTEVPWNDHGYYEISLDAKSVTIQ
ncbi:MAG: polysaccharide deacetylase family protein [Polyangiaceae bacterium]